MAAAQFITTDEEHLVYYVGNQVKHEEINAPRAVPIGGAILIVGVILIAGWWCAIIVVGAASWCNWSRQVCS